MNEGMPNIWGIFFGTLGTGILIGIVGTVIIVSEFMSC